MTSYLDEKTGRWVTFMPNELHPIERFYPDIISMCYYRPKTTLIQASLWGQYRVTEDNFKSNFILSGERYLRITKVWDRLNWLADEVYKDIKESENKIFVIFPTPYLQDSLKPLTQSYFVPPVFWGDNSKYISPKVIYSELSSFKEEGNRTSEVEDLASIIDDLRVNQKLRFDGDSGFDFSENSHVDALKILVKLMLQSLVSDELILA